MWKANWSETRERFAAWWQRRGLLLGAWGTGLPLPPGGRPHADAAPPPPPRDPAQRHRDPLWVSRYWEAKLARCEFPADVLPIAWPDLGTVTSAVFLGAGESYGPDNIWYEPCLSDLESAPPLRLDLQSAAYRVVESVVRATVAAARGRFLVGMPAIVSGLDVLAALRGEEGLLVDMALHPESVHRRLAEIRPAYRAAFEAFRSIIGEQDDTMSFGYFMLWGAGSVGLCQCDLSAMISPLMFDEFVLPDLREQAAFLDRSMFHVDGKQALVHVDSILSVERLDAVEFTPDPTSPGAGDPAWYPLYRRILDAGKAVWIAPVRPDEVSPLLRAVGSEGVYLTVATQSAEEFEAVEKSARPRR